MRIIEKEIDGLVERTEIRYQEIPAIDAGTYAARMELLISRADACGYTHIIVYADREHFSNMEYLCGYDPRFEEALLILGKGRTAAIVVGNEGIGYADMIKIDVTKEKYQTFSLPGQPRGENSKDLKDIFTDAGIDVESKIGIIGWKNFKKVEFNDYKKIIEIPAYIVKMLEEVVGDTGICNANDLMIGFDGLRMILDAKEIILAEVAGTKSSRKVLDVLKNLKPGMTEIEASEFLCVDGDPLCTHPNICFGDFNCGLGLASPSYHDTLHSGDQIAIGLGYRRALTHKCGIYAKDNNEIVSRYGDAIGYLYKPYFSAVATWLETVRIGVTCGEVYAAVDRVLEGMDKYSIYLNPGHMIHTDEWTNSFFYKNSDYRIKSGMMIQCDIIATWKENDLGAHCEDGIAIADQELRNKIKEISPQTWERIQLRRDFIRNVLNIDIHDEVLPMSDLCGVCFPYMADLTVVLAQEKG